MDPNREDRKRWVFQIKERLNRRGAEISKEQTVDAPPQPLEKKDRFALSLAGILAVLPIALIFLAAYFFLVLLLLKLWLGR